MNKFQFVRMLKDIVESNGIDWIKGQNPSVKEQYNAIVRRLRDKEGYHNQELTKRALNEFFNVDGAFENVDPRQFSTYMSSIKNGNNPQSMLYSLYTNSRDMDDIRSDFNNAKDVYPHEIMGYSEDEFYNPSNPNYWGGMDYYKNEDGTLDSTRGFLKKMVENNMETKEFLKLLQEEQRKRDLERIWDFQDKRNYDGLGSGDGIADKLYRNVVDFSARNYWGNTVNDYKSGEALNDKDYGIGGLNTFDVFSNVADGVTGLATPFAPVGKVGNVIKGIGYVNDAVQPIARESYESDKYGRDFDVFNPLAEGGIRAIPYAMSIVPKLPGKLGEYANKVDDYIFGNQKTDDAWNVFGKKSNQAIKEQSTKPMHNPEGVTMVDKDGNPVKYIEGTNDLREVRNPNNFEVLPSEEGAVVLNKLETDLNDMNTFLELRKDGNITLFPGDEVRIRELAKQYPEFNAKYFGKDMTIGMKAANAGAKYIIDNGKKAVARNEPKTLDISKLGTTNEDYNTISKAYNELAERKPDAVYSATHYSGGGKGLTEYEKAIVKKYLELNLYHGRNGLNVFN